MNDTAHTGSQCAETSSLRLSHSAIHDFGLAKMSVSSDKVSTHLYGIAA